LKYQTSDLLKDLGYDFKNQRWNSDPLSRVTNGDVKALPRLQSLLSVAPELKDRIANSYLHSIFENSTRDGGFSNTRSAANAWNKLNPEVKNLLFDKDHAQNISSFLNLSKKLDVNPNSSNTGAANQVHGMLGQLLNFGSLASGVSNFLAHPIGSPMALGAELGATRGLTHLLYNPDGAIALKNIVANGINSVKGKESVKALREIVNRQNMAALSAAVNSQDRNKQDSTQQ
jgi:hypothetical protein